MTVKTLLQFSHLCDEEFLMHLFTKDNVTNEELEAAHRIEQLLGLYRAHLERVHNVACDERDIRAALARIREMTRPGAVSPVPRAH